MNNQQQTIANGDQTKIPPMSIDSHNQLAQEIAPYFDE